MADVQVLAPGVKAAPLDYVIPGAQEILVKAIAADFDGSGAGGSFVPAIQIIAPGNKLAGTFIANGTVAAGASASISWAPFLAGGGPGGIRFDTDNQGGYLDVTANATSPATGESIYFADEWGSGIKLNSDAGGDLELVLDNGGTLRLTNNGTGGMRIADGVGGLIITEQGGIIVQESGGGDISIAESGGGSLNLSSSDGDVRITTTLGGTQIYSSADGYIFDSTHTATGLVAFAFRARTGDIFAVEDGSSSNFQLVQFGPGVTVFNLQANKSFTVKDHSGNTILRVDENGPAYHIKTGKAWVADL